MLCFSYTNGVALNERQECADSFPLSLHKGTFQPEAKYFIAKDEADQIVAVAQVSKGKNSLMLDTLEVALNERHHGAAKAMLHALVDDARAKQLTVGISGFTGEGKSYLLREINRINEQHQGAIQPFPSC